MIRNHTEKNSTVYKWIGVGVVLLFLVIMTVIMSNPANVQVLESYAKGRDFVKPKTWQDYGNAATRHALKQAVIYNQNNPSVQIYDSWVSYGRNDLKALNAKTKLTKNDYNNLVNNEAILRSVINGGYKFTEIQADTLNSILTSTDSMINRYNQQNQTP